MNVWLDWKLEYILLIQMQEVISEELSNPVSKTAVN